MVVVVAHGRVARADVEVVSLGCGGQVPPHPFLLPGLPVAPVEDSHTVHPEAHSPEAGGGTDLVLLESCLNTDSVA